MVKGVVLPGHEKLRWNNIRRMNYEMELKEVKLSYQRILEATRQREVHMLPNQVEQSVTHSHHTETSQSLSC